MDRARLRKYAQQHLNAAQAPQSTAEANAAVVRNMLEQTKGVTFASIVQATRVRTAAAYKSRRIIKISSANIILANNLNNWTSVYRNKVERETGKEFVLSDNWFEHTDCFSIVKHKTGDSLYLYGIYNSVQDGGYWDADEGVALSKSAVAALLTPKEREKLLDPQPTYNVRNDVYHNVVVRTVGLENVVELKVNGEAL